MDTFSIVLFLVSFLSLLAGAIWLIWSTATSRSVRDFNPGRLSGTWTTEVKKPIHPELVGVERGEKLMGVTFEQKTECDLEEYRDLQARIEELKAELEDPWEDEDDDEGGLVGRK